MKKTIRHLIGLTIVILILVASMILGSGYSVYNKALDSKGAINEKVEEIRSTENYVKLDDINNDFKDAIVAIEDFRFYEHGAIELRSLIRAMLSNFKAKDVVQGGSTITQQVAKNIYFENDQSFQQKIAEMIIGYQLEKVYSKEEILELYVNIIYYGDNNYGIKEASNNYFKKTPKFLSYEEATLLAGLPQAPSLYALSTGYDLAKERQKQVNEALDKYRKD